MLGALYGLALNNRRRVFASWRKIGTQPSRVQEYAHYSDLARRCTKSGPKPEMGETYPEVAPEKEGAGTDFRGAHR
jgi:hypothetical protein